MKTKKTSLFPSQFGRKWLLGLGLLAFLAAPVRADDDTWDVPANPVATTNALRAVAHSGKLYVAVGGTSDVSFIATSKNARDWTERTSPVSANLSDVAWSGTVFAAVGGDGKIITSTDGVSWTARTSGVTATLNAVIWAKNQFVAVGDSTIITSSNGITWSKKTVPPETVAPVDFPYDRNFQDVTWTGSKLVVVSPSDVTISTTGATWARQVLDGLPVGGGDSIAWNGQILCKLAIAAGTVETSVNGSQWTSTDVSEVTSGSFLYGIGAIAGSFFAVGAEGCIITSSDGLNWLAEPTPSFDTLFAVGGAGVPTTLAVGENGTVLARGDLGVDGPIVAAFTETDVSVDEGGGSFKLTVRLSDVAPGAITIPFTLAHGTSIAKDIKPAVSPLKFKEGDRQLQITIPIIQDVLDEDDETFTVTLGAGSGYTLDAASCSATIVDDDTAPGVTMLSKTMIVSSGEDPELSVFAEGSAPLTVQWRKNNAAVKGAVGETYTLTNVTVAQGGSYDAQAKNPVGTATSTKMELAVVDASEKYSTLLPNAVTTLTAAVGATANTLTFQWQKDDQDILGATSNVLKLTNVTTAASGDYVCLVTQTASGNTIPTGVMHLSVVTEKPVLAALALPTGQVLRSYTHQVLFGSGAARAPGKFTATGLPDGLTINADTGLISGTPTAAVTNKTITITAKNAKGSSSVSGPLTIQSLPPAALGAFQGLVARGAPAWADADRGARLQIDTTTTGAYTGKLLNGSTLPFKGQLFFNEDGDLISTTTVPLLGKGAPVLTLTLTLDVTTNTLSGELRLEDDVVEVSGWRNVWTAANPATAYLGQFNFIMANAGGDPVEVPGGDGYGSFKVLATGSFDIKGRLPDGAVLLCNTFLGPQGQVLLYQTHYTLPGSILGRLDITLPSEEVDFPTITPWEPATWNKPPQTVATDKTYKAGFELISLDCSGGLYTPPPSGQVVMGMSEVALNALVHFTGGGIDGSETFPDVAFTISPAGVTKMPLLADDNPAKVTFSVSNATGEFSGTFTVYDSDPLHDGVKFARNAKFYGLISKGLLGTVASGVFTVPQLPDPFAEPVITAANAQTLTGRVTLEPNPDASLPVAVQFADSTATFGEGDGTVSITVSLSEEFATTKTIPFTLTHGHTSAADFTISSSPLTFPAHTTEATITLTIAQDHLDEDDEEDFTIKLVDGLGYDLGSPAEIAISILDDDTKPSFVASPLPRIVGVGDLVEMEASAEGDNPITLQWRRNEIAVDGEVGTLFSRDQVQLSDAGSYDVIATNPSGTAVSEKADLAVVDVSEHPVAAAEGGTATFSANFVAASSLTFQWQRAGLDLADDTGPNPHISGATSSQLVITNVSDLDSADYTCTITQVATDVSVSTGIFHLHIVAGKPVLYPFTPPEGAVAVPFSYQVGFDDDTTKRPSSFSATGLPAGLAINTVTGLITGIPTTAVTDKSVTITATNSLGSESVTGAITIAPLDSGLVGTYQGYVGRIEGIPSGDPPELLLPWANADLGARLTLTTTISGSYSGQLITATETLNLTPGQLITEDESTSSTTSVPRVGLPALLLNLIFDPVANTVTGTLGLGADFVAVSGWRNVWSAGTPASGYTGRFNFVMQVTDTPSDRVPGGFGFGSAVIPASGNFDITGKLPDGTAFLCNSFLGANGEILLFQKLYTEPGSLVGKLIVSPDDGSNPAMIFTDGLTWSKPVQTAASVRTYKDGIDLQPLSVSGGVYIQPVSPNIIFDLPDQEDNASLSFADGGLDFSEMSPNILLRLKPGGTATLPSFGDNPAKVTFTFVPATGAYSGTFTLVDPHPSGSGNVTRTGNFSGLVTQNILGAAAFGFFTLPQLPDPFAEPPTTSTTSPILTGQVRLDGN